MSYHPTEDLYALLLAGYTVTFDMEEAEDDTEVIVATVTGPGEAPKVYRDRDFGVLHTIRTDKGVPDAR